MLSDVEEHVIKNVSGDKKKVKKINEFIYKIPHFVRYILKPRHQSSLGQGER